MEDLGPGSLGPGESTVASRLPGDTGSRLGNWLNNRDVLSQVMREGEPIRDASVDSAGNLLNEDTRRVRYDGAGSSAIERMDVRPEN
jgi:hypothetical protein